MDLAVSELHAGLQSVLDTALDAVVVMDLDGRRATARQTRRLREFHHRRPNMLSVVLATAHQTARNSPDVRTFQEAFAGRLETLAHGHDLLVASEWTDVDLAVLSGQILGA